MANWLARITGSASTRVEPSADIEKRSFRDSPVRYRNRSQDGGEPLDLSKVGIENARSNAVLSACLRVVASHLASRELVMVDADGSPSKSLKAKAVEYRWNRDPGNGQSASEMKNEMMGRLTFRGQAHALIGEDGSLTPLIGKVTAQVSKITRDKPRGELMGFLYEPGNGYRYTYAAEEILWLRIPDPENYWLPLSPVAAALSAVGLAAEAQRWQAAEFANGAANGLVSVAGVSEEKAYGVADDLAQVTSGADNGGRIVLVTTPPNAANSSAAATYTPFTFSPREMSWLDSLSWTGEQILIAVGVPRDMVLGGGTFNNSDTATKNFWRLNLIPTLDLIASAIDKALMPEPTITATFPTDDVEALQEDKSERARVLQMAEYGDMMTMNQIFAAQGLPEMGPEFDFPRSIVLMRETERLYQSRPTDASGVRVEQIHPQTRGEIVEGEVVESTGDPDSWRSFAPAAPTPLALAVAAVRADLPVEARAKKAKGLLAAVVTKDVDRLTRSSKKGVQKTADKQMKDVLNRLNRKAKRTGPDGTVSIRMDEADPLAGIWFDDATMNAEVADAYDAWVTAAYVAGTERLAGAFNIDDVWQVGKISEKVEKAVTARALETAAYINKTTKDDLAAALIEGIKAGEGSAALARRVRDVYAGFSKHRAETIARDTVLGGYHEAAHVTAMESGVVVARRWQTASDDRVRPSHALLDGVTIKNFTDKYPGGAMFPGDRAGEDMVQCRCVEEFLTEDEV